MTWMGACLSSGLKSTVLYLHLILGHTGMGRLAEERGWWRIMADNTGQVDQRLEVNLTKAGFSFKGLCGSGFLKLTQMCFSGIFKMFFFFPGNFRKASKRVLCSFDFFIWTPNSFLSFWFFKEEHFQTCIGSRSVFFFLECLCSSTTSDRGAPLLFLVAWRTDGESERTP